MRFLTVWLLLVAVASVSGQEVLPLLEEVPLTSFSCLDRPYGYYADIEANCQAFHVCLNNLKWSFLCPNQTLFNQEYLVCDHAINVDCSKASSLYSLNDNFGIVNEVTEVPSE